MVLARQFSVKFLVFVFIISVILVGCSVDNTTANPDVDTQDVPEDTQFPITIEHAFGNTTIDSKPERVATIAWANHDVALALGVVPVGFSAANYGVQDDSGLLPWTAKKLQELGVTEQNVFHDTAGIDFEAISDTNPDVILAAYSGITQEEYETLSQIAPVVAYPGVPWVITWSKYR